MMHTTLKKLRVIRAF